MYSSSENNRYTVTNQVMPNVFEAADSRAGAITTRSPQVVVQAVVIVSFSSEGKSVWTPASAQSTTAVASSFCFLLERFLVFLAGLGLDVSITMMVLFCSFGL
jgi:hypothetical protein